VDFFKKFDKEKCSEVLFFGGELYKIKKGRLKAFVKPAVALNCCHGGWGEGGGAAGLMQQNGIPFASPNIAQSGIFLDKSLTKLLLRGIGIPVLDYMRVTDSDYRKRGKFLLKNIESRFGFPIVVKPANLGSSIGISVAGTEEEASMALETAFLLDDLVVIERYLEGKIDVNCAVCKKNGEIFVSEPEIACKSDGIYSFESKYLTRNGLLNGKGKGQVRTLDVKTAEKIRSYSRTVYKKTGLNGVVRMDYLVTDEEVYLSEVNTVPGSLAYYLFCERLTDGKNFLTDLLLEAVTKSKEPPKLCPETGVLDGLKFARK
jgi:D-alanine-D-alanine ligase